VSVLKTFLQLLAPFAPHLAEELWAMLIPRSAFAFRVDLCAWPKFDPPAGRGHDGVRSR